MDNKIPGFAFTPAEYLAQATASPDLRKGLPVDAASSFYAGYLALCQAQPDLVNSKFNSRHRIYKHELNPLQVIAGLAPHFFRGRNLKEVPTTLEELAQLSPQQPDDVNGEWTAAVLMACGVDPWDIPQYIKPQNCHHPAHLHPVPQMVVRGWCGVLRNALNHPSAPDIEQVAQMEVVSWGEFKTIRAFALGETDTSVLKVLHECGMELPSDDKLLVEELGQSSRQAIEYLSSVGALEKIPAKLRNKVENVFAARVKAKSLHHDHMAAMVELLTGRSGQRPEEVAQTAMFDSVLSVPWCGARHVDEKFQNFGVAKLNEVGVSKSQLKGRWSFLGAYLMSYVRRAGRDGTSMLSLAEMIKSERRDNAWRIADLSSSEYKGILAPAVSVQWRDGISMAAPILMYLLAIKKGHDRTFQGRDLIIKSFCTVAGIDDFRRFVADHANEMALFTSAITRNNSPAQHKLLGRIWGCALSSDYGPVLASSISEENRINVLLSLTGNFFSSKSWDKSKNTLKANQWDGEELYTFKRVAKKLFPPMKEYSCLATQFEDLRKMGLEDSPHAQAALIYALATEDDVSKVLSALGQAIPPKSNTAELLRMWVDAHKKDAQYADSVAQVKAALLSSVAAESGVKRSTASQRVKM